MASLGDRLALSRFFPVSVMDLLQKRHLKNYQENRGRRDEHRQLCYRCFVLAARRTRLSESPLPPDRKLPRSLFIMPR